MLSDPLVRELVSVLRDLDALLDDSGACLYPKSPLALRLRLVLVMVTKEMPAGK